MVVNWHGFAAAVLGTPAAMVDHFVGVGLADTAGSMALNIAVAAPTVQSHRIIQKSYVAGRSGSVEREEIGIPFELL